MGGHLHTYPWEGEVIYFKPICHEWGLNWKRGLFNLEKTMLLVLHNELQHTLEKLKYKKGGDHAAEDHHENRSSSW